MKIFNGLDEFVAAKGSELGPTEWLEITQERVNLFADATDDHQWIHVDPEKAAGGPFGGTIAHGFLTLSLMSQMSYQAAPVLEGVAMGVNYGFDKLRFMHRFDEVLGMGHHSEDIAAVVENAGNIVERAVGIAGAAVHVQLVQHLFNARAHGALSPFRYTGHTLLNAPHVRWWQ